MDFALESEGTKIGDKNIVLENNVNVKNPMLSSTSLASTECYDENQNSIYPKQINQIVYSYTSAMEDKSNSSVDRINNSFQELQIQPRTSGKKESNNTNTHVAGKISNIISTMNIVLVQALSAETLLYIGTPLFISYEAMQNNDITSYVLLGSIDDILGNIGNPMYSVDVANESPRFPDIGEQVYYFSNNPSTQLARVEHTLNTGFNKIQYKIRIKDSW